MNALNVYQLNNLRFTHKQKLNKNPKIFVNSFNKMEHKYPTRNSRNNFKQPKLKTRNTSFAINDRGPYLWNKYRESFSVNAFVFKYYKKKTIVC